MVVKSYTFVFMKRIVFYISFVLGFVIQSEAQIWSSLNHQDLQRSFERKVFPEQYHLAGLEEDLDWNRTQQAINLPLPDGTLMEFHLISASNFHPGLQARYPEIRTYKLVSKSDAKISGRLDKSTHGIHAVLRHPRGEIYLDALDDGKYYLIYHTRYDRISPELKEIYTNHQHDFQVGYEQRFLDRKPVSSPFGRSANDPVSLNKYRLALAATAEYTQKHNGTVEGALAAMNTALNRINFVLETELAIQLELIENNDSLIFFDAATDPYSNGNASTMASENNNYLIASLGTSTYDVGHVFGTGCNNVVGTSGGVGTVCGSFKGFGSSCELSTNDRFYIGVVCHELGHQFGAEHTWNNCPNSPDGQFNGATAFEPGSGSTIMSYAGACGDQNITSTEDPYYHVNSLEAIIQYTRVGGGTGCGEVSATNNRTPVISTTYQNGFFIPISTPFKLTAQAADLDGDTITYTWEQYDPGIAESSLNPNGAPRGDAPIFRSVPPTLSPTRIFPALSKILANNLDVTEVLPTYDRKLTFRATARDNHVGGGGVDWTEIAFRADENAGPFRIEEDVMPDTVFAGDYINISWDVANTDQSPVNCRSVNILLSLDGGQTITDTLVAATDNDGQEFVLIPDVLSAGSRIYIEAADNIFFDVNDENIVILQRTDVGYALDLEPHAQTVCLPGQASVSTTSFPIGSFTSPIQLTAIEVPEGISVNPTDPFEPGIEAEVLISLDGIFDNDTYPILFQAVSEGDTLLRTITVSTISNDFSELATIAPAQGASGLSTRPTFMWDESPNALSYDVQLSASPAFDDASTLTREGLVNNFVQFDSLLQENTLYYWRVRPSNDCGDGSFSKTQVFQTVSLACETFEAEDLPMTLSQSTINSIESTIPVSNQGIVSDVNIQRIDGFHESFGDLTFSLRAPSGAEVLLVKDQCGFSNREFTLGFDDESTDNFTCTVSFNGQQFIPAEPLSAFQDESIEGDWTLIVADSMVGGPGRIDRWQLELCGSISPIAPDLSLDTLLALFDGESIIDDTYLSAVDDVAGPDALVYTLTDLPRSGTLFLDGDPLETGDQFSQEQVSFGALSYLHNGIDTISDQFEFTLIDGTGGWTGPVTLPIEISNEVVSTFDLKAQYGMRLFPNPASSKVNITSRIALNGIVRVANLQGQLINTDTFQGTDHLLSVADLHTGMYVISITSGEGIASFKLLVQ